ncbi:hypothetical protein [uncultured Variovorax sp.]|mgnify:CR=1 FL=1|uniref:hypothetical protein n=1 Tax=uncultured Variovorax sp. TaxID=114708 RepID=UPI002618AD58|nr:hypothetical protein [uncultured Variovorax sp.]
MVDLDVSVIVLFAAAVVCGVLGAFVASVWIVHSLRTGHLVVKAVDLPRQVVEIEKLKVALSFSDEDGTICMRAAHEVTAKGSAAALVQHWLDANGLVLNFKSMSNPGGQPVKQAAPRP